MNAWLNYVGIGSIALSALACGSKGSDEGDDDNGTGGTSGSSTGGTGGSSTGGSNTGGTSGSATGGTGGGTMSMLRNGFATDKEGWIVEYTSAGMLIDLSAAMPIDKGAVGLEWTGDEGDPDVGALEAAIPYETESQYVGIGINYAAGVDMSTTTITAHVKVKSGLGDPDDLMTNPGGAKIYAKSGMIYCYAAGDYNNITMIGEWMTISFNLSRPPGYVDPMCSEPFDPTDIREVGIQFDTGGTSMSAQPAVIDVDTIMY